MKQFFLTALVASLLGIGSAWVERPCTSPSPGHGQVLVPIEKVRLGQRVVGWNPLRTDVDDSAEEVCQKTWRQVKLGLLKPDGHVLNIELLRPVSWIGQAKAVVGQRLYLDMPEMGAIGEAKVLEIGPCPPIASGPGNVCIGKFYHRSSGNLLSLRIEGEPTPTRVTASHPYWSEGRKAFVAAGQLRVGETLRTRNGSATVVSLEFIQDEPVCNLEIHREHVYMVGSSSVLVHNSCFRDIAAKHHPPNKTPMLDKSGKPVLDKNKKGKDLWEIKDPENPGKTKWAEPKDIAGDHALPQNVIDKAKQAYLDSGKKLDLKQVAEINDLRYGKDNLHLMDAKYNSSKKDLPMSEWKNRADDTLGNKMARDNPAYFKEIQDLQSKNASKLLDILGKDPAAKKILAPFISQ